MIHVKSVILLIVIFACSGMTLWSQEKSPPTSESLESLRQSIDKLQKLTEQSKEATKAESTPVKTGSDLADSELSSLLDSLSEETKQDALAPDLFPESSEPLTGVDEILYTLELLKKVKSEKRPRLEDISPSAPSATNPLRDTPEGIGSDPSMTEKQEMSMIDRGAAERIDAATKSSTVDEQLPARPVETPFTNAKSVIPGPINPFEMGNSLFQTGKIATALDAYETVDMDNMTVFDAAWLRYMKATCHRQLGNRKEADRIYREISKEKNVRVLVESAQWWLSQSDRTKDFDAQLQQLQINLESMEARRERIENQ